MIVFDDALLPDSFADAVSRVYTRPYIRQDAKTPAALWSITIPLDRGVSKGCRFTDSRRDHRCCGVWRGSAASGWGDTGHARIRSTGPGKLLRSTPTSPSGVTRSPRPIQAGRSCLSRNAMPPPETMPQDGQLSSGPHSNTSWVNMIGVPAIVVPAGLYANGLPLRSGNRRPAVARW